MLHLGKIGASCNGHQKEMDCRYGGRGGCVVRVLKRKINRRRHWQLRSYLKEMTRLRTLKMYEELVCMAGKRGVREVL